VDLRPFLEDGPLTLVMATMADKDVPGIVAVLEACPALADARVVCTAVDAARAMPAEELARHWRLAGPGREVRVVADPAAAVDAGLAGGQGPVVVAGSLYLVGAVRARLVDDPALRDPR
jgi:folylpolyglutamate synthase/dihydropteroate synthase